MVRGDCRDASELYMLNGMYDDVDATVGRCSECIAHVLSYLIDRCFVFMFVCVGRIYGDPSHIVYVIFGHDVALILCSCDGCIDKLFAVILIHKYVFAYFIVLLFMASLGGTDFELDVCAGGFYYLTRIGQELY